MAKRVGNRGAGPKGGPSVGDSTNVIVTVVAAGALVVTAVAAAFRRAPEEESGTDSSSTPLMALQTTGPVHAGDGPDGDGSESAVKALIRKVDEFQRANQWAGFPLAVVKKFTEDKAGFLAALVAYFGFFSLFPLMLAFTSILGFVLPDPEDQQAFSDAAADQIPVVGDTIRNTAGQLEGSVLVIVVGLALALWSGLRIVDAMQNALNDVWDLPRIERPKLVKRRLKGILMLLLIGGGLVGSVAATNVASLVDVIPGGGKIAIWAASAAVSIILYVLSFQLLTDRDLPWKDLWPGAIFGGVSWWALQTFGSAYIVQQQESANEAYGQFAAIIALMAFLFLAAQLSILGAEISVVKSRGLWPRSLVKGEFTAADVAAYEFLAASTQQDEHYVVRVEPVAPVVPVDEGPEPREPEAEPVA